jgi:hypothetical protein
MTMPIISMFYGIIIRMYLIDNQHHNLPHIHAKYAEFEASIGIADGRKGIFDLKPYLDRGVFRELRNVHYFNQVSILFGAVTWPNEQDIAPETLLAEMLPLEQANPPNESLQPV